MTSPIRLRFTAFCAAIAAFALLVGWSAFTGWREVANLRRHFTAAEYESFHIAERLQFRVLRLSAILHVYELSHDPKGWTRFQQESVQLDTWIDRQHDALKTAEERHVLADIDAEYDRYRATAQAIHGETAAPGDSALSRAQRFDAAAQGLFTLAGRLAAAHRHSLGDLLAGGQRSLQRLELLFGASLLGLLVMSAWAARVLFQDTIAPLRTQLVEAQALAERSEKLASLGVLAAGVAHEIRNPLTAIKLRAYLLRENLEEGALAGEDVSVIDREINHLERIVNDFLLFARPGDPHLALVSARNLFQETSALLAPELAGNAIDLRVERCADEMFLRADAQQLKQVLINLIRNGAESIGREGRIVLRAVPRRLALAGRTQDVLVLEVEDTGAGIPAEVQARLFDPFFTTKPAGTGLGLSIAMRILESHGGTLQFQTAPGRGTTFGLVLPIATAEPSTGDACALVAPTPLAA